MPEAPIANAAEPKCESTANTPTKRVLMAGRICARHRIAAYAGGFAVGALSYVAYHWINTVEFLAAPRSIMERISTYEILKLHPLSFVLWQSAAVIVTCAILYLWSRIRRLRQIIEQAANIDGLTGMCSHRMLQEVLETEVTRAYRYGRTLSVVMFDIDDFKTANEQFGHPDGDQLLCRFAEVAIASIRGVDTVARYGGDEFVLVLPETTDKAAALVAERVRMLVERAAEHKAARGAPACTVSAGIASLAPNLKTRHALLLAADIALYHAKCEGKNKVVTYTPELNKTYRTSSSRLQSLLVDDSFGAIEALSAAVDAKDHSTRGHSESVTVYAVELGSRLGLSDPELENLRASALLHDIGKIGMPDSILKKPGGLDQGEWEVVESHTVVGSQILEKIHQLKSIIPGVRHHHERFDGMGYPNGLLGAQIPLLARIISLADAYDAMVSERSYRKAMTKQQAIEEIERCAGTQFDPQLVKLFVSLVSERDETEDKERAA
ncbi:MAG: diguanylate cyclase [Armatimonadota bacterium]|nr:diguanylate cyclase [Armatimonadota bacterium]